MQARIPKPQIMKLFGSTEKINTQKTKNGKNYIIS